MSCGGRWHAATDTRFPGHWLQVCMQLCMHAYVEVGFTPWLHPPTIKGKSCSLSDGGNGYPLAYFSSAMRTRHTRCAYCAAAVAFQEGAHGHIACMLVNVHPARCYSRSASSIIECLLVLHPASQAKHGASRATCQAGFKGGPCLSGPPGFCEPLPWKRQKASLRDTAYNRARR